MTLHGPVVFRLNLSWSCWTHFELWTFLQKRKLTSKMPNPIKAFFERKKLEAKFKVAGKGQKLGDAATAEQTSAMRRMQAEEKLKRDAMMKGAAGGRQASAAQHQAAEAAMARFSQGQQDDFAKKRSQAVIRAQAQRRLEMERKVITDNYFKAFKYYSTLIRISLVFWLICPFRRI